MSQAPNIDGVPIQWDDRLFYPGNRVVKVTPQPKLNGGSARCAAAIRERIEATVVRRVPQVHYGRETIMWIAIARTSPPDAAYWPGRRLLAVLDAIV